MSSRQSMRLTAVWPVGARHVEYLSFCCSHRSHNVHIVHMVTVDNVGYRYVPRYVSSAIRLSIHGPLVMTSAR